MNLAINWNFNPEIIDGWSTPNWYGLLFVTGLMIGFVVIRKMFRQEQISDKDLDKLLIYVVIATIVGARLGHVFFYDWETYKNKPFIDVFKVWEGGLASHGGAIALLIALYMYNRFVTKRSLFWIFDKISAPIAIAGTFIRLGNLANGEIVGNVTTVPWGFRFMRNDCKGEICPWEDIPVRHAVQLYEAIAYFLIFFILYRLYWKLELWKKEGKVFGWFLILLFGARFILEFFKDQASLHSNEVAVDVSAAIGTGQWLSVPFILLGLFLLFRPSKTSLESNV